jgi:hypothetical protein
MTPTLGDVARGTVRSNDRRELRAHSHTRSRPAQAATRDDIVQRFAQ